MSVFYHCHTMTELAITTLRPQEELKKYILLLISAYLLGHPNLKFLPVFRRSQSIRCLASLVAVERQDHTVLKKNLQ